MEETQKKQYRPTPDIYYWLVGIIALAVLWGVVLLISILPDTPASTGDTVKPNCTYTRDEYGAFDTNCYDEELRGYSPQDTENEDDGSMGARGADY